MVSEQLEFNVKNFEHRKAYMLQKLSDALDKNEVDRDIIVHLGLLNRLSFCFTTSSCSGRIALIDAPLIGPKYESKKVHRWHDIVKPEDVWNKITEYTPSHILWLKFDSFIISFSVCSIRWAMFFIKLARYMNLKDSGIRSINPKAGYINMDFMSTEKISVPVKTSTSILLDKDSMVHIIKIANFLMRKNKIKLQMLRECLELIVRYVESGHNEPPQLRIFDPVIKKYRDELARLRNSRTFRMYDH